LNRSATPLHPAVTNNGVERATNKFNDRQGGALEVDPNNDKAKRFYVNSLLSARQA
jgi:hypothetical protein